VDVGAASIVAALIAAVGAVIVASLERLRRENKDDHGEVIKQLGWLRAIVERVESKHDTHVETFHATPPLKSPQTSRGSRSSKTA